MRHSFRFRLTLSFRQVAQINHFDFLWLCLRDHLYRCSIDGVKSRPQSLVTTDELAQAAFKSSEVEWTTEILHVRNVVDGSIRFELVQKPQSLLREREW